MLELIQKLTKNKLTATLKYVGFCHERFKLTGEKPPSKPDMWLEVCSPFITVPNTHHSVTQLREVDEEEPIKAAQSESVVCTVS